MIADLYHSRWQVEVFPCWLKQHLNVSTLFWTTENAVYDQLFGSCIAYVLLHMFYNWKKPRRFQSVSMLDFMRDLWNFQLHPEWVLSLFDLLRASHHLYG